MMSKDGSVPNITSRKQLAEKWHLTLADMLQRYARRCARPFEGPVLRMSLLCLLLYLNEDDSMQILTCSLDACMPDAHLMPKGCAFVRGPNNTHLNNGRKSDAVELVLCLTTYQLMWPYSLSLSHEEPGCASDC